VSFVTKLIPISSHYGNEVHNYKKSPSNALQTQQKQQNATQKTKPVCLIAQGHTGLQLQNYKIYYEE
jgi:hypothetical protein